MNFIKLTDHDDDVIYINPSNIVSFYAHGNGSKKSTRVNTVTEGFSWSVKESPEEVMALIEGVKQ
jgi:hypothetical protein